jgi:hypothetical protein
MAKKQYTAEQLKKKYKGQFIHTHAVYDHSKKRWLYEVRRASKIIRENCNLPEDELRED